jgi:DNA invertase Pin-like site-specific DNA recombinase
MKTITRIDTLPRFQKRIRVAAYARVSTGKDAMLHSLSQQVDYYRKFILKNGEWEFVGVYADEATSGTKDTREEFQRMLSDCRLGKIDMIITKSISRFARNTVTLLETVRELKDIGVDVYFEEQNLHSISGDGELMLSILASFAQEEAKSVSDNMKWIIRKYFKEGLVWNVKLLGYDFCKGHLSINQKEAELVKMIYGLYLGGKGFLTIAKYLNSQSYKTSRNHPWALMSVQKILTNETYTGNLLLQKTYKNNFLEKKKTVNQGELPRYRVEHSHPAIIDLGTFNKVQEEIARRASRIKHISDKKRETVFRGKIICGQCGKHYQRKVTPYNTYWICPTFSKLGKDRCASK